MNIDDLKYVLDRTTELVRNTDSKNNIMIAIAAGLVAVLFSNEAFLSAIMTTVQAGISLRLTAFCALVISLIVFDQNPLEKHILLTDNSYDINNILGKLDTYKFTFTLNSNNYYYFTKVEKI